MISERTVALARLNKATGVQLRGKTHFGLNKTFQRKTALPLLPVQIFTGLSHVIGNYLSQISF